MSSKKLILAAKKGDLSGVQENLAAGISVASADAGGSTPLYWAAYKGHTEVVLELVRAKADINVRNGDEHTPLIEAVLQEQLATVRALLVLGADRSLTLVDEDDGPQTALELARENELTDIVAAFEAAETPDGLARLAADIPGAETLTTKA
jgi:ankyrin repeat protein